MDKGWIFFVFVGLVVVVVPPPTLLHIKTRHLLLSIVFLHYCASSNCFCKRMAQKNLREWLELSSQVQDAAQRAGLQEQTLSSKRLTSHMPRKGLGYF